MKGMKGKSINIKVIIKFRFYFWQYNFENFFELCFYREKKNFKLVRRNNIFIIIKLLQYVF